MRNMFEAGNDNTDKNDLTVYYVHQDLKALAARTGETVEHYLEMMDYMAAEDRLERFPYAVANQSGLTVTEVLTLLTGHMLQ